jgi:hypothetical protein
MSTESAIEFGIHRLVMKNFFLTSFCFFLYEELNKLENLREELKEFKIELIDTAFVLEIPLHCGISFKEIMRNESNKIIINDCIETIVENTLNDFKNYLSDNHLKNIASFSRQELRKYGKESYDDIEITGITVEVDSQTIERYIGVYKAIQKTINGEMFHNDGSYTTFS